MSGMRSSRCSNITRISMRARLAPRQKCGPPAPKAMWGLGLRVMSKVCGFVEDALVPVGRDVEEHHLGVLLDRLAAELEGRGGLAPEVHDRGDEAEHLLDGVGQERPVVAQQLATGRGGRRRRPWPPEMRLRVVSLPATVSRRKKSSSSNRGELLAVDLDLGEHAHQVVVGVDPLRWRTAPRRRRRAPSRPSGPPRPPSGTRGPRCRSSGSTSRTSGAGPRWARRAARR